MIIGPNTKAIEEIILLEAWRKPSDNSGAFRLGYTEIDKVLLLCNACELGTCTIDYWIREEENRTECKPQVPCCPKCPQWTCPPGCHGEDVSPLPGLLD